MRLGDVEQIVIVKRATVDTESKEGSVPGSCAAVGCCEQFGQQPVSKLRIFSEELLEDALSTRCPQDIPSGFATGMLQGQQVTDLLDLFTGLNTKVMESFHTG